MNGTPVKPMAEDAGDALASGSQVGAAQSKDITIPADLMPGCKEGDSYTVKSMDGDNVVLEATGGASDEGDGWGKGLVDSVNKGGMNE